MLTSLTIENFAIVCALELDFNQGLSVFTGETGAGKSIMIDALMLALGGRADPSVVRPQAEKCDIHAQFTIAAESPPAYWLKAHDLAFDEGHLFLRRVIYPEGRSKSYINGHPFPSQKVKELSHMLVDIHGQHQHQSLLHHSTHRQQLDNYAQHHALLAEVQAAFKECQRLEQAIVTLEHQDASSEKAALLQFQWDELAALNVQEGEIEQLHLEHQQLHHGHDYLLTAQHIVALLSGDDEPNIRRQLHQVQQFLATLPATQPHVVNTQELINNALIQCDEALDEIEKFARQIQLDPQRLQIVEARMSLLHQMARKYHVDVHQLLAQVQQIQQNLQTLELKAASLITLKQEHQAALAVYQNLAQVLTASRVAQSIQMAQAITPIIQQLGMPHGYIEVHVSPLEQSQLHGMDRVEYQVCTNVGGFLEPLGKIASGGELSRISLAIEMITAQRAATPTLLFDEVDVGIGGATAALVGKMLKKLAQRLQVLCVTHQPQVASSGDHHFRVEKYTEQEQTFSRILALDATHKIEEIARMLGGLTINDQTRLNAQALLAESAEDSHA